MSDPAVPTDPAAPSPALAREATAAGPPLDAGRRQFLLSGAALLAGAVAVRRGPDGLVSPSAPPPTGTVQPMAAPTTPPPTEPFYGVHQGGIITSAQKHTCFAAFDLVATSRADVVALLKAWTISAERLSRGLPATPAGDPQGPALDSGDVLELPPARLTITLGFGSGLFILDGKDRYGLAAQRPQALVDMPSFPGDQLVAAWSNGDLSLQACADDAQVAFHALRQLAHLGEGTVQLRWLQNGFLADFGPNATVRNLMGFKDGTGNPAVADPTLMDAHVWVGAEGPAWMQGGAYVVARRSRIALEHWDRMAVAFQEQTFGRQKRSGAPLGKKLEGDNPDFDAVDADGNPIIPENAHMRLAHHLNNDGARILRRSYNYQSGADLVAERWPPWHQGLEYDAGLLFICYQKDPRAGFIKIFTQMAKFDMMNQFVTNLSSGLFACPRGARPGEYLGQHLFEPA